MLHSYSIYTTSFTLKTNAFSLLFVSITHNIFNSELESVGSNFIHFVLFVILQAPKHHYKDFIVYLPLGLTSPQKQNRGKKKT